MVVVDMNSGVAWTLAVLIKAHSKVVVQSHGKLAPEVVIHKVQSRGTPIHRVRSFNNNRSDTVIKAMVEQNYSCKQYAIRSKPTKSKVRKT